MRSPISVFVAATVVLPVVIGCAAIPNITVSYRPVKSALLVTVAHTVTCNREGTRAIVERGATFLPIYSAARADPRFQLQLKDLDRFYADADMTLALTDDGRLKSINQSTTGQGEAIVKSTVAALATVAAAPAAAPFAAVRPQDGVMLFSENVFKAQAEKAKPSEVCRVVRDWSLAARDKLPQVSVVQTALIVPTVGAVVDSKAFKDQVVDARASKDQEQLLESLKRADLDLSTKVTATFAKEELQPIAEPKVSVASNEVPLTLQRMVALSAAVADAQGPIGSKSIPVPSTDVFVVPIPKAALFGKQSFSLALADSGRIASIGYGRTTGVSSALGAVTAVAGAETTEDNAEVAAMKAAADLIAQQQRYNNCRLNPPDCK